MNTSDDACMLEVFPANRHTLTKFNTYQNEIKYNVNVRTYESGGRELNYDTSKFIMNHI